MKKVLSLILLVILTVCFSSCSSNEKEVICLFTWEGYVPLDIIEKFTKETGIEVNYTNFSTNEEMYAKLKAVNAGEYDVVLASDYIFETMARDGGLMTEIDKTKISNWSNISKSYLNKNFDPGNKYTVPYATGSTLIAYNPKTSPVKVTGYKDLLNPKLKGQIVSIDEMRVVIGMMNLMLGNSLNETDEQKLADAKDALNKLMPNVLTFNSDKPHEVLLSGEATVGLMYSSQVSAAIAENSDIEVVYPVEGIGIGIDSFCIPFNAPNKEGAYKFIDFLNRPEINAAIMPQIQYGTTNAAAVDLLDDEFKNNKAINIPEEYTLNSEIICDVGDVNNVYSDIWTQAKMSTQ
ncbi:MAG: spermidine/putrescine ABC transporter substrate-binding protein [Clostridia bacterium]|nr:spermidine/putrescine ABC transporter substrate-binding protein [Clostridia bacterium]